MVTSAPLATLAAWLGVLGMLVASLNAVAMRLVHPDEVPRYARARIRWWSLHNPALMLLSTLTAVVALTYLATS